MFSRSEHLEAAVSQVRAFMEALDQRPSPDGVREIVIMAIGSAAAKEFGEELFHRIRDG